MIANAKTMIAMERYCKAVDMQHQQLQYNLARLQNYCLQATFITGFAFHAFSAAALSELPYATHPKRSLIFAVSAAVAMASGVGAVTTASYLMVQSERLGMTTSVEMSIAASRKHTPYVQGFFICGLIGLFVSASSLLFAICREDFDSLGRQGLESCNSSALIVMCIFFMILFASVQVMREIRDAFRDYRRRFVQKKWRWAPHNVSEDGRTETQYTAYTSPGRSRNSNSSTSRTGPRAPGPSGTPSDSSMPSNVRSPKLDSR